MFLFYFSIPESFQNGYQPRDGNSEELQLKDVIDDFNISSHIWSLTLSYNDLARGRIYHPSMRGEINPAFATHTLCKSTRLQNHNVLISNIKSYPLNCAD